MTIRECYERFKHLDNGLSDLELLEPEETGGDFRSQLLFDMWQVIKDEAARPPLREEVVWFAGQMEAKLKANDHKGGWEAETRHNLIRMLDREVAELWAVANDYNADTQDVIKECADVANYCLMIADVTQGRKDGQ